MLKRAFFVGKPDPIMGTDHIWTVAGALGAVTFNTAMMFEAEIGGENVKQWGDGHVLLHRPWRSAAHDGQHDVATSGWIDRCHVLEVLCWANYSVTVHGWDLKLAWQAAQFKDDVIFDKLEEVYATELVGESA